MHKIFYCVKASIFFSLYFFTLHSYAENPFTFNDINNNLKAYSDGKTYLSISILKDILFDNPNDHRARLELASAYYHLALYEKALTQLSIVQTAENIPHNVKQNTTKFIQKINDKKNRIAEDNKTITASLFIFSGFDSNANIAPSDKLIKIDTYPYLASLSDEYTAQEDGLFGVQLDLEHSYRFSGTTNINNYAVYRYWESGLSLYTQQYFDQQTSNLNVIRLQTGPLFKINPLFALKLNFKVDHYEFQNNSLASIFTFKPQLKFQLKTNQYLGINLSYSDRQFIERSDNYREGSQWQGDFYYSHKVEDSLKYKLGVSLKNRELNSNYLSYNSVKYQFLIQKRLDSKNYLEFISNFEQYFYDDIEKYYDDKRHDNTFRSRIKYQYDITRNISWGIRFTHFNRRSNHQLHSYDRNIIDTYLSIKMK